MKNFKRLNGGFTLVELAIVLAIGLAVAIASLSAKFIETRNTKATNQGNVLAVLRGVAATYQTEFYGPLVNSLATMPCTKPDGSACFPDRYNPTIDGLRAWGKLDSTFVNQNAYGPDGFGVFVDKLPSGCSAPNCDLFVIVYLKNPMIHPVTQRIDGPSLGMAASVLESEAGFSTLDNPAVIVGANGSWSVPNPVKDASGSPVAGILAMRAGYGSSGMSQFMRRDGELEATGTQKMGGQDVIGVNNLKSTGIQNSGNAAIGGTLGVTGQTSTNGIANNGTLITKATTINGNAIINGSTNINGSTVMNGTAGVIGNTTLLGNLGVSGSTSLSGTLAVTGQTTTNGVTNNGHLDNTGDVQTGRLYLRTIVANGASCAGLTGYQASTAAGSIASCINGTWQTPAANIPPPSPCQATNVSFQGCSASLPYTNSGQTATATVYSGNGSATYSCNNGSWAFLSGNCTPPPASCPSQTIYWSGGASCSGTMSTLSHGSSRTVNDSGGKGSISVSCNDGRVIQSSGSCRAATTSYSYPTSREGYSMSASPGTRASFCQWQGKGAPANSGHTEQNFAGQNMTVCWSMDGAGRCTGQGNCNGFGAEGCWVQSKVVCTD